ncbi:MAG TPA: hypothetical protein VIS07_16025 [Candidatus Binatia bacterium]
MSVTRLARIAEVMRGLAAAREGQRHERLDRRTLEALQRERLTELVRHAVARSPLYADLLRGIDLSRTVDPRDLPIVDKQTLMARFDDWVTDRRLRLADLDAHLAKARGDELYLGDYRVMATSGTTGRRGIFVYSRADWAPALGGFLRASQTAGARPRLPRYRIGHVAATSPLHMTARFGMSADVGLHRVLRLDARSPLRELADALAAFRPDLIGAYPSVLALLADEQIAGRLDVAPSSIIVSSEVCTPEMARRIRAAWGVTPFDVYASTESGVVGIDCEQHQGRHVFEDLVLLENVDERGEPVPDGQPGARVLITNLFNGTQPLIRYELSDIVVLDGRPCACGRGTRRIVAIEGRSDDILMLPGRDGRDVAVHPLAIRSPFAGLSDVRQYQLVHDDALRVRVVPSEGADPAQVAARVHATLGGKLAELGVAVPKIEVETVATLTRDRGPAGKLKLIESKRARSAA